MFESNAAVVVRRQNTLEFFCLVGFNWKMERLLTKTGAGVSVHLQIFFVRSQTLRQADEDSFSQFLHFLYRTQQSVAVFVTL